MRFLIVLLAGLLWAAPAQAVILQVVASDANGVTVTNGDGQATLLYRNGSDPVRAADLIARLNAVATNQQELAGLPLDDGIRLEDPGLFQGEREYWCNAAREPTPSDLLNATHLCSRADIITNVVFDALTGAAIVTIRTTRDCTQNPDFPSCL